jgi:hypothetical protein
MPTDCVAIDMIANDSPDYGVLEVDDISDNLLETYTIGALYPGEVETATISQAIADVDHILAAGSASIGDSILLNHLQFATGPKPIDVDIKPGSDRQRSQSQ